MTAATCPSLDQLQSVLDAAHFLGSARPRVQRAEPGVCELLLPFEHSLERPGGLLSGMVIMGVADVAMWLAIMTVRGTAETWVTTDMKTAFLKSGRSEDILCTARLLKHGRRTAYGEVATSGLSSGLLAHHVVTYAHLAARTVVAGA